MAEKTGLAAPKPGRDCALDLIRIAASLMVVMIHAVAQGWYSDMTTPQWAWLNLLNTAVRSGVPLFFMVSGVIFLGREELDLKRLLWNHEVKYLALYLFWSVLYCLNTIRVGPGYDRVQDFVEAVFAGHFHLWYLPAMVAAHLFLPVLHACVHGKKLHPALLLVPPALFFLRDNLLLLPWLPALLRRLLGLARFDELLLYLGYTVLGWWLSRRTWDKRSRPVFAGTFLAVTLLAAAANRWYALRAAAEGSAPVGWLYGHTVPTLIQAVCVFCFFLTFRGEPLRFPKLWTELSACTLGVYLIHVFLLECFRLLVNDPIYTASVRWCVFSYVLAVAAAFFLVWLIRKIPVLRKLV